MYCSSLLYMHWMHMVLMYVANTFTTLLTEYVPCRQLHILYLLQNYIIYFMKHKFAYAVLSNAGEAS